MPPANRSNQKGKKKKKSKNEDGGSATEMDKYPDSCLFCEASDDDEEVFGRKVRKCGITVHYFCMLFSSGLSQRGKTEEDGIYGFLPSDIGKEKSRGARLRCIFCRKNGATIGCVVKNCRRVFHFGCGQKAGALNQYFDSYRSYCTNHRPRQTCPVSDRLSFYGTANSMCVICMSAVEARASNDTLRAPCCKNTWFHRKCIQRQALAAGLYFFKCPLCCNKEVFQAEMLQVGIYIPEQDAAWEMEPHAYQELLEPYNHCDMDNCLCPRGRKYNRDESKWEIVVCHWCGSQGSHIGCNSKRSSSASLADKHQVRWSCQSCNLIDTELRKERKKKKVSPVNPESSDTPNGKSRTTSEHVGRKLPVKLTNTLHSPSEPASQGSLDSPLAATDHPSASSTSTPKARKSRRRKNLWSRGLLMRHSSKKRKAISATVTQAQASLAENEHNLNNESPSQLNTENVNPETSKSGISSAENAPATSQVGKDKYKKTTSKKTKSKCSLLKKPRANSDILSDIRNNKLCDSVRTSTPCPDPRLRRRALPSSAPYVLRDRKNSDSLPSPLPHVQSRRSLRSNKTTEDFNLSASWRHSISKSPTFPKKNSHQYRDGNLKLDLSEGYLKPRYPSLSSSCSTIEVTRESQSSSAYQSPVFSRHLAKELVYFNKENSKSAGKMVDCDCIGCSEFIIISSDSEADEEEANASAITSLLLSETDDSGSFTMSDDDDGEFGNGEDSFCCLQEQKCNNPNCDCTSEISWYCSTEMLSSSADSAKLEEDSTPSTYELDNSYHELMPVKPFTESSSFELKLEPMPLSPSKGSLLTLNSSSDYESCKSSIDEFGTNSYPPISSQNHLE